VIRTVFVRTFRGVKVNVRPLTPNVCAIQVSLAAIVQLMFLEVREIIDDLKEKQRSDMTYDTPI
jgi:hypothetical protein